MITIKIKKSSNAQAWSNNYVGEKFTARKKEDQGKSNYIVTCSENEHVKFNTSWVTLTVMFEDAIEI